MGSIEAELSSCCTMTKTHSSYVDSFSCKYYGKLDGEPDGCLHVPSQSTEVDVILHKSFDGFYADENVQMVSLSFLLTIDDWVK
jgi:hypothetical protein